MTSRLTSYSYALFALALSASLLIGAWIFQYGFGYAPCQMCYWQRHAHKAVVAVAAVFALLHIIRGEHILKGEGMSASLSRLGSILITLAFLLSTGLALWHVGVELGYIEALPSCAGGGVDLKTLGNGDLLGSLDKKIKPPACSAVVWSLMGISMAGYNAVFSLLGAALGIRAASKRSVARGAAQG